MSGAASRFWICEGVPSAASVTGYTSTWCTGLRMPASRARSVIEAAMLPPALSPTIATLAATPPIEAAFASTHW